MFSRLLSALLFSITFTCGQVKDPMCNNTSRPPGLPDCTDNCLLGMQHFATCAYDFQAWCGMNEHGLEDFFHDWDNCLMDYCNDEEKRFTFIAVFQDQCSSAGTTFPSSLWPDYQTHSSSTSMALQSTAQSIVTTESSNTTPDFTSYTTSTLVPSTPPAISNIPTSVTSPTAPVIPQTITPTTYSSDIPRRTHVPSESDRTSSDPKTRETVDVEPSESSTAPAKSDNNPTVSTTKIALIATGGVAGVALVIGLATFFLRRRRHHCENNSDDAHPAPSINDDRISELHAHPIVPQPPLPNYGGFRPTLPNLSELDGAPEQRAFLRRPGDIGRNF